MWRHKLQANGRSESQTYAFFFIFETKQNNQIAMRHWFGPRNTILGWLIDFGETNIPRCERLHLRNYGASESHCVRSCGSPGRFLLYRQPPHQVGFKQQEMVPFFMSCTSCPCFTPELYFLFIWPGEKWMTGQVKYFYITLSMKETPNIKFKDLLQCIKLSLLDIYLIWFGYSEII